MQEIEQPIQYILTDERGTQTTISESEYAARQSAYKNLQQNASENRNSFYNPSIRQALFSWPRLTSALRILGIDLVGEYHAYEKLLLNVRKAFIEAHQARTEITEIKTTDIGVRLDSPMIRRVELAESPAALDDSVTEFGSSQDATLFDYEKAWDLAATVLAKHLNQLIALQRRQPLVDVFDLFKIYFNRRQAIVLNNARLKIAMQEHLLAVNTYQSEVAEQSASSKPTSPWQQLTQKLPSIAPEQLVDAARTFLGNDHAKALDIQAVREDAEQIDQQLTKALVTGAQELLSREIRMLGEADGDEADEQLNTRPLKQFIQAFANCYHKGAHNKPQTWINTQILEMLGTGDRPVFDSQKLGELEDKPLTRLLIGENALRVVPVAMQGRLIKDANHYHLRCLKIKQDEGALGILRFTQRHRANGASLPEHVQPLLEYTVKVIDHRLRNLLEDTESAAQVHGQTGAASRAYASLIEALLAEVKYLEQPRLKKSYIQTTRELLEQKGADRSEHPANLAYETLLEHTRARTTASDSTENSRIRLAEVLRASVVTNEAPASTAASETVADNVGTVDATASVEPPAATSEPAAEPAPEPAVTPAQRGMHDAVAALEAGMSGSAYGVNLRMVDAIIEACRTYRSQFITARPEATQQAAEAVLRYLGSALDCFNQSQLVVVNTSSTETTFDTEATKNKPAFIAYMRLLVCLIKYADLPTLQRCYQTNIEAQPQPASGVEQPVRTGRLGKLLLGIPNGSLEHSRAQVRGKKIPSHLQPLAHWIKQQILLRATTFYLLGKHRQPGTEDPFQQAISNWKAGGALVEVLNDQLSSGRHIRSWTGSMRLLESIVNAKDEPRALRKLQRSITQIAERDHGKVEALCQHKVDNSTALTIAVSG